MTREASVLLPVYKGMALAALSGLLLGGAMKPQLKVAEGPEGPQQLLGTGAPRSDQSPYAFAWANYEGEVPDYVVGSDWLRPPIQPLDEAYVLPEFEFEDRISALPPVETPAGEEAGAWNTAGLDPSDSAYPSTSGDILSGLGTGSTASEPAAQADGGEPGHPSA